MFAKNNFYVLNPKNVKDKDLEIVGEEGLELAKLYKTNLKIPESFIITTLAFDNLLTATDVVDPIMKELKKVQPFVKSSALEATENIKSQFKNVKFPSIIAKPIEHAYKNLSDSNNPIVSVYLSHVIDGKHRSTAPSVFADNVKGLDSLFETIYKAYQTLFSLEQIETRTNSYFKGGISLALIVQKSLTSDLSGKLYSFPPKTMEKNTIEIKALYGLASKEQDQGSFYDVYKLDDKSGDINEKQVVPQEFMYVRKGKITDQEDPYFKVPISDDWQKKQKLSDNFIEGLFNAYKKIDLEYKHEFEASWSIIAGEIYISSINKIDKPKDFSENLNLVKSNEEHENSLTKEEKFFDAVAKEKEVAESKASETKPDIKLLTQEIQGIVEGTLPSPDVEINVDEDKSVIIPTEKLQTTEDTESKPLKGEHKFITEILLDISKMSSVSLQNVKQFSGGFFNGTEAILRNGHLPEEILKNHTDVNNLMDKISLDIATAAKSTDSNYLIYQFSNIGDYERKLLGIDSSKYKLNGDERFIENPETLAIESMALLKARNVYSNRNIRVSFPAVRNSKNFLDIKKILAANNFRRSTSLKFYCEVSVPSIIFDILELDEASLDGIIVDYNMLLRLATYRESLREVDHSIGLKILKTVMDSSKPLGLEVFVRVDGNSNEEFIKNLLAERPTGLIFKSEPDASLLSLIKAFEEEHFKSLSKEKKRGRRIKELF